MDALSYWRRYKKHLCECPQAGLTLDISRVNFTEDFFREVDQRIKDAYRAMGSLEAGDIANPSEERQVGHYWLRAPHLAPTSELTRQIEEAKAAAEQFAAAVHDKTIAPPTAARFTDLLVVGIGGSALGPQLIADALGAKRDKLKPHFIDNTDPDGVDRVIDELGARLKSTLVVVISKSGGTKETRNGMLEIEQAFRQRDLELGPQAVAVTGDGSLLDAYAKSHGWLKCFPMWDWVGGRTSLWSSVGLVPALLQGINGMDMLAGAAQMDHYTRMEDTRKNPAALLALMWLSATQAIGAKDMVVLPYKDRLLLFSRYLQQLVMESLGKEHDLQGQVVNQGIAVYGNKGSTDQHAYVQQLRDGVNNFFATFVVVLTDRTPSAAKKAEEVEPGVMSGDYLNGFWQGTRQALTEKGRESITITLDRLDASRLGALLALFERAVGFYASLVNVNAYDQPGVEAGKKAAADVLALQHEVMKHLDEHTEAATAERIADAMGRPHDVEAIHHLLTHLSANKRGVARSRNKFRRKA